MKLNPLLCGWVSPMLETRIRGPCLVGDREAQHLKAAPVEVLLLLVDGLLAGAQLQWLTYSIMYG